MENPSMTEFDKSIEELLRIGDCLKLCEKQFNKKLDQQKNEFDVRLRRTQEQIEAMIKQQIDQNEKYITLNAKYMCCVEELSQFKQKFHEKDLQIDRLEKRISLLTNEQNSLNQIQTTSTQSILDDQIRLIEQTMLENEGLKRAVTERDGEIIRKTEQFQKTAKEIEKRLLQHFVKVETDFRRMFDAQSTFFLQKIGLLKEEHRRHIAELCKP